MTKIFPLQTKDFYFRFSCRQLSIINRGEKVDIMILFIRWIYFDFTKSVRMTIFSFFTSNSFFQFSDIFFLSYKANRYYQWDDYHYPKNRQENVLSYLVFVDKDFVSDVDGCRYYYQHHPAKIGNIPGMLITIKITKMFTFQQ